MSRDFNKFYFEQVRYGREPSYEDYVHYSTNVRDDDDDTDEYETGEFETKSEE